MIAAVVLAVAVLGQQQFGTHNTPAGQPPLAYLESAKLDALRAEFNEASAEVRIILLLSPT